MTEEELKEKELRLNAQEAILRDLVESHNYAIDLEISQTARKGDKQRARSVNIGMTDCNIFEISMRHTDGTNYWIPLGFTEIEILIEQMESILRINNYQRSKNGER